MKEKLKRQNYLIPESLIESLKKKSEETGLSMSDLIRMAIKKSLKN